MKRSAVPLPIVTKRRKRRRKNRFICQGQCGKDGCTYAARYPSELKRHVSTDRFVCEQCGEDFSTKSNMLRHQTAKHNRLPKKNLRKPDAIDLTNEQWQFLKKMVARCVEQDQVHSNVSATDRKMLEKMSNVHVHDLAEQLAPRAIEMVKLGSRDDFGGYLKNGIRLRAFGGLFKLSLDRKRNRHANGKHFIHFPDPSDVFANIRLVALCSNVGHCGPFGIEQVRVEMAKHDDECDDESTAVYESKKYKGKKTTLYRHATNIHRKDEACRQCFETANDYWRHLRQLLEEQRGRCALSGIRLRTNAEADRCFLMSPDAIDPLKGHVPGNLRLVCRFLNPIDCSKQKTVDDPFDGPAQWTRSLVEQYYFGGRGTSPKKIMLP